MNSTLMIGRFPARRAVSALASLAAAALALGGCALAINGPAEGLSVEEVHPISLDPVIEEVVVDVTPDTIVVSEADKARIRALVADYKVRGRGPMAITAPSGTPNATAAVNAVAEISSVLVESGISPNAFRVIPYRPSDLEANPPVVVSYPRVEASVHACGYWADLARSSRNLRSPDFGCSTQSNLAAMLSNPQDLAEPRAIEPSDARRRDTVFGLYRQGKPTATERTKDEKGTVSVVKE